MREDQINRGSLGKQKERCTEASTIAIFIPKPISRAFASAAAMAIFAPARVRLSLDCVIEDIIDEDVEKLKIGALCDGARERTRRRDRRGWKMEGASGEGVWVSGLINRGIKEMLWPQA
jgi:hypothetical protein